MGPKRAGAQKRPAAADATSEPPSWVAKAAKVDQPPAIMDKTDETDGMDYSSNTRQQCHVFEGMLPTLSAEIREKWKELCDKKGTKGMQQLKNALRNSVVKKDASYELTPANLNDVKAERFLKCTRTVSNAKRDEGVSWSTMERLYHYNADALKRAKDAGHIWAEEDSDGEEMWYEKKKIRESSDKTEDGANFTKDMKPTSVEQYHNMIKNAVTNNKAWLRKALGDTTKQGGSGSSSRGEDTTVGYDMMKTMQDAWDASTQLTADAGRFIPLTSTCNHTPTRSF